MHRTILQIEEVCNLPTREQREKRVINLFNTNATFDIELMEGLKIMMMLEAVSLHQKIRDGEEVAIFAHLLFARETSETVGDLLKNHLNCIGDSGGMEQVSSMPCRKKKGKTAEGSCT